MLLQQGTDSERYDESVRKLFGLESEIAHDPLESNANFAASVGNFCSSMRDFFWLLPASDRNAHISQDNSWLCNQGSEKRRKIFCRDPKTVSLHLSPDLEISS